jgi:hypothetical protein
VSRLVRDPSQDDDEWEDLEQPTAKETDKQNPTGEWEDLDLDSIQFNLIDYRFLLRFNVALRVASLTRRESRRR